MGTLGGFASPSAPANPPCHPPPLRPPPPTLPPPALRAASPNPPAMLRCWRSQQAPHAPILGFGHPLGGSRQAIFLHGGRRQRQQPAQGEERRLGRAGFHARGTEKQQRPSGESRLALLDEAPHRRRAQAGEGG